MAFKELEVYICDDCKSFVAANEAEEIELNYSVRHFCPSCFLIMSDKFGLGMSDEDWNEKMFDGVSVPTNPSK